jgi:predicted DNA-binding protein
MFTTTISITQEDHRKLKHLAVDQGVSVRDLIRDAIERYLEPKEKEKEGLLETSDLEK